MSEYTQKGYHVGAHRSMLTDEERDRIEVLAELLLRRRRRFSILFQAWLKEREGKPSKGDIPTPIRTRRVERIEAEIESIMKRVMPQFDSSYTYHVVDLWAEQKGVKWDGT